MAHTDTTAPRAAVDVVQLARLLDRAPDAIVLLDRDARVVWGNRSAERLFGIPMVTAGGTPALDLVHPDDLDLAISAIGVVQGREVGRPLELRVNSPTGWRLVEVIPASVSIPTPDSVLVAMRDLTDRRRWEVAASETAMFRSLLHNAATVTMLVSADGVIRAASGAFTRLTGFHPEDIADHALETFVAPRDRPVLEQALQAASEPRQVATPVTVDVSLRRRGEESRIAVELTIVNLLDDPTVEGFVVSAHDATERKAAEAELREALSLLHATFNSTVDGVLVVDSDNRIVSYNRRFVEMWSLPDDLLAHRLDRDAIEYVVDQLVAPEAFVAKIEELYSQPEVESHDTIEFKDGRVFERFSRPQRVGGRIVGRVWSFHDVTPRKRLEEELVRQALHDSLTGLANQALFRDRVEHALQRTARSGRLVAVLFMDLDSFKNVNDSLGHAAGDRLLVTVADRLRACVRSADTAARLGGDEFAVLLEDLQDDVEATDIADRIIASVRDPIEVTATNEVVTSVSIGIALGDSALDADQLLRNADLAMYTAKARGRGRHARFQQDMHIAAMERLELEADLRHATERGEFVVLYQPIVELGTGLVVGAEALVRWQHPRQGLLNPASFIPLAEETGLINELGEHILATAASELAAWNRDPGAGAPIDVSVNLSPRQLLDLNLPRQVERALARTGLRAEQLIIEITEGAMVQDAEAAERNVGALHRLGVRLAVDDFGTGYSSLSHLQRFPIDIVKIDRSFVSGVDGSPEDAALAKAIVGLARTLGMTAIAEGVETPGQAERLHAVGCEYAQGFYFAAPLTGRQLLEILRRGPIAHGGAVSMLHH